MTGPLQRIRQAIGSLFRRGPPPQRVTVEKVGKGPETPPTGPINRPPPPGQQQRQLYRVGFNPRQKGRVDPRTGERFQTGILPTKAGVEGALRRVPTGRVEVRVYGTPAPGTVSAKSPPDQFGNVYRPFFTTKADLEAALAGSGSLEDAIFQAGGWNFTHVLAVSVGEA